MTDPATHQGFERVAQLATHLPAVERSTSYGTASLKVRGKSFCRMKERMDDVLVVMVPIELKQILIEAEPDKYFGTAHYAGYPAMLVRLANVTDEELQQRLETAWLEKAPKKLAATWLAAHGDGC
jgi:hypothetical protein